MIRLELFRNSKYKAGGCARRARLDRLGIFGITRTGGQEDVLDRQRRLPGADLAIMGANWPTVGGPSAIFWFWTFGRGHAIYGRHAGQTTREEVGAQDHQGTGNFPGTVRGRRRPFQFAEIDCRMGRRPRLQGRADPHLGRASVRPQEGGRNRKPIATRSRASAPTRASRSPSFRPICKASWSPFIRPTTSSSTASHRLRCTTTRRLARNGPSSR